MRYKRLTASLDEMAKERLWGCNGSSSSGSDTSASSSPELADLVNSFYGEDDDAKIGDVGFNSDVDYGFQLLDREKRRLEKLLVVGEGDLVGKRIKEVVEMAVSRAVPEDKESKRWIMSWLRYRGFDAGLYKSRPSATTSSTLAMNHHQYIDVITSDGPRYLVEMNLAAEFEIARPTPEYSSLLDIFPALFVGKPEMLREVVEVMCNAAKESMQRRDMHVPPWRRKEYMVGKWFGPCKRSINPNPRPKRKKNSNGGGTVLAGQEEVVNCDGGGWKWRGMEVEKIGVCL